MARPRVPNPKSILVPIRLTEREAQALDANRKGLSRSAYLRRLLAQDTSSVTELRSPAVDPKPPERPHQEPVATQPPDEHADSIPENGPHWHRYKKAGEPVRYTQGRPVYRQKCTICGDTKVGE